ncbi:MAG: imelysin family protein [Candidatus Sericytochromatia bacterium]
MIRPALALPLLLSFNLLACQVAQPARTTGPKTVPSQSPGTDFKLLRTQVLSQYAQNAYLSYTDALKSAQDLQKSLETLVASPSESHLEAAREAWKAARKPYGWSEALRFYGGPIDDEAGPEPWINSWPLDEGYIDYVEGQPEAGIIQHAELYPEISPALLRELNAKGGDKNISTGYHAIEFLLWGQDLTAGPGAGQRSFTDYVSEKSPQAKRRGQYLLALTQMLVTDLEGVVAAWKPEQSGNYRARFLQLDPQEALGKLLRGVATLSASELASERLGTPLDIGEREEEHSCFSDETHHDILYNAQSIRAVLTGKQAANLSQGPGLIQLVQALKPELASQLQQSNEQTLTLVAGIQPPFDQEIRPGNAAGNQRILALIQELKHQGSLIVEAGKALGIQVSTDL